jgi:prepilin-type N-terminal cleavage/methylation domain-containing protein
MAACSFATRYPLPATRPRGFTLPEVLLALMLLGCGALALVAASATAIRAITAAETQTHATAVARTRIEHLAAGGCSTLRNGSAVDSSGAMRERWTVTTSRNGARLVTDTVEYTERDAIRLIVLERLVVC